MNNEIVRTCVALTLSFVLSFCLIRQHISNLIDINVNRSARKKIARGQSFLEWFLVLRFRRFVPKIFLLWYFAMLVWYLLSLFITVIIVAFCGDSLVFLRCDLFFEWIPHLVVYLVFKRKKFSPGLDFSRYKKNKSYFNKK